MWKNILSLLIAVDCIILIVIGQWYWNKKIDQTVSKVVVNNASNYTTQENQSIHNDKQQLMGYSSHLPRDIRKKIEKAADTGKPVRLVIFGSEATPISPEGWPNLLQQKLDSTYGSNIFSIFVKEYKRMTTTTAVQNQIYKEIIDLKPDIILFEPFILNNNGVIPIDRTIEEINTILTEIKLAVPDVSILLQPPHPIYNAYYYPLEVNRLKQFAQQNNYVYLDHWKSWPDYKSKEIIKYLDTENDMPNPKGNRLWANFLIDYFVSQKQ